MFNVMRYGIRPPKDDRKEIIEAIEAQDKLLEAAILVRSMIERHVEPNRRIDFGYDLLCKAITKVDHSTD